MEQWIRDMTEGWTTIHWGAFALLVGLWVLSSLRLAMVASRTTGGRIGWFVLTLVFLGVPTWIKIHLRTGREIRRRRLTARTTADLDAAGAPGLPLRRCPHCRAVLDPHEMLASYPDVRHCPRCGELLEGEEA